MYTTACDVMYVYTHKNKINECNIINQWLLGEGKSVFIRDLASESYPYSSRWSYTHEHSGSTKGTQWVFSLKGMKSEEKSGGKEVIKREGMREWLLKTYYTHVQNSQTTKNKAI